MARRSGPPTRLAKARPAAARYWELARRLGVPARQGRPLREFLDEVAAELLDFTAADQVQTWLRTRGMVARHVATAGSPERPRFDAPWEPPPTDRAGARCLALLEDDDSAPVPEDGDDGGPLLLRLEGELDGPGTAGVLALSLGAAARSRLDVSLLEEVARDLSQAIGVRRVHASLRERMKELDCLYRMALIVEQPATSLEDTLQRIVETLPGAWLHADHAWVRLELAEASYGAGAEPVPEPRLAADIVVAGRARGTLAVGYTEPMPAMDEGPFLAGERTLIQTVAREVALIIERHEVAEESRRLEAQLEHAERLATIGELAAGIGHELNDPLNNILGYARFIAKREDLPPEVLGDAEVVVTSALHARDTIRQLLTFARRMPQRRTELRLDDLVRDALPLLQALAAQAPIEIATDLADGLPPVSADPGQLRQVLVNLVANAVHAMPDGGRVTVAVAPDEQEGWVRLAVADTGSGMTEDVVRDAFLPFFTTREEGTGLGLAVVHGIVAAHGGTIDVSSRPGAGSRFEVRVPGAAAVEAGRDDGR